MLDAMAIFSRVVGLFGFIVAIGVFTEAGKSESPQVFLYWGGGLILLAVLMANFPSQYLGFKAWRLNRKIDRLKEATQSLPQDQAVAVWGLLREAEQHTRPPWLGFPGEMAEIYTYYLRWINEGCQLARQAEQEVKQARGQRRPA